MKAIVYRKKSVWPVHEQLPENDPGPGQVRVDLYASAFNRRDYWITKGKYPGIRDGVILGSDGAGTLDGKPVVINPGLDWGNDERYQSSQFRILGMPDHGTFAEYLCINKDHVYPKPDHLSWEEAAAFPLAGLTAYRALFTKAQAKPGEKIFITGIGGGVATMVLQFARAIGMQIVVSSGSETKIKQAMALGAEGGVNYRDEDWAKQARTTFGLFDVIVDSAGGPGFGKLPKLCNSGARIVIYGGTQGKIRDLSPQILFWKQITISGTSMASQEEFASMLDFVRKRNIVPVVDSVFQFKDYLKAFRRLADNDQFGKIVLNIRA